MSYLMTIVDRYSRWIEAVPLTSITAADCAQALLRHWVSRYGSPQDITTDQGPQFTSVLWTELMALLGVKCLRTTSYHPQCNGMVERVHRVLKERLMSRSSRASDWMQNLPWVLLGMSSSTRDDSLVSPAHLLYGAPLRLPGEFFPPSRPSIATLGASDFVARLRDSIRDMTPFPADFHQGPLKTPAVPASLSACPAVFVRVDAVKRPLTPPYIGPFEVLQREAKTFTIKRSGKPWTVSIDRLKPFFPPVMSAPSSLPSSPTSAPSPPAAHRPQRSPSPAPAPAPAPTPDVVTRAGRVVRPPDRYSA